MAGFDQFGGYGGDEIRCSFCGKTRDQVSKLIQGMGGVYICDECVAMCNSILDGEFDKKTEFSADDLPKPKEI
ncbi:MAG: ATP-dependent Clp protease ATP-binding subunit ClpX, partial [Atopobiaceae bacterium]|nr:ATP-dependent Clp protease ATP-binding subunit ClpX [Atopobiaceae bacterium]